MVHPVKKLVEVCHRHGVIAVIDGAHAPGQIPLNLPEIGADFYAGKSGLLWKGQLRIVIYSKCPTILNRSCLPLKPRQTR